MRHLIRDIPNFPKPGITFKDITPLLADHASLREIIRRLATKTRATFNGIHITKIAAIESRGFIFGGALALGMDVGFVPIRKPGKLPHVTLSRSYDLEYGRDTLEMHKDALYPHDRVLLVDDILATGGTAMAAASLIRSTGATLEHAAFLGFISHLQGHATLRKNGFTIINEFVF